MTTLFFAQIRDFTGCPAADIAAGQSATSDEVWSLLADRFPGIEKFRSSTRLTRNGTFASDSEMFQNTDEVALIPPVSGG
ncbi:MAG: MoaD/ThiS family protein [Chthoniobacterales bacterium]